MKKAFLLLAGIFSFQFLLAQDCEVRKDPFTNEEVIGYHWGKSLKYEMKSGETTLEIEFTYSGNLKVTIPEGSEILFKMENGAIIKKATIAESFPKSYVSGQAVYTNYPMKVLLNEEDIIALAGSKVEVIRYPDGKGGSNDWDIKGLGKLFSRNMKNGADCIRQHLKNAKQVIIAE